MRTHPHAGMAGHAILAFLLAATLPATSAGQGPSGDAAVEYGSLSAQVQLQGDQFHGWTVRDAITNRTLHMDQAFVLVLKDQTRLASTQMTATRESAPGGLPDPHSRARPREQSCWDFRNQQASVQLQWCLTGRPGSDYLRELLRISAVGSDLPLAEVRLLDFSDRGAHVDGAVKGSPIVDGNMFFGVENPLSTSSVDQDQVHASVFRELPLRAGQSVILSAVLGTAHAGQLRRAFGSYIENERPRPYRPFLHYNSWFDLGYGNRFDEAGVVNRINAFGQELTVQRRVELDSFLLDDGWDDPASLWGFNAGFPNGFTNASEAAAKYGAAIGVWFSPWGGYDEAKKKRIAYGQSQGYEILNGGYALSGPKYFQRFEDQCLEMIQRYHVNQFKFDGTGNANRVFPASAFDSDFDAAIHLIERLRQQEPGIFINLTTGTTASPFWLFYADSIWRGGEDTDFSGVGSSRQRWITYRDAQTYKNIVQAGPLFPLNSLMLHGIVYAKQAERLATDPNGDFADEVHSYFGSGTQLQEMYITPSLLSAGDWDTLAEAARWSRTHADTLRDVHWIGGDPDRLQVYGWAAWSPRLGILTVRNPSLAPQIIKLDLQGTFELQKGDPARYTVHSVWSGAARRKRTWPRSMRSGKPFVVRLAPFEVLTLEAIPATPATPAPTL